ncbi:hypothetical protein B8A46_05445 [Dolosigranulum pigrum]|uniref:hypothetical protein n=1 Tax=Dolosigranulum pigrum TaxID=29394 RepID=UPI000DBF97F3|nr:hypothetical protein [Dolosigranulum pigrum]RAN59827.1 hypothetical protein B8A46_05445 [Dolosigranulum pigrum]
MKNMTYDEAQLLSYSLEIFKLTLKNFKYDVREDLDALTIVFKSDNDIFTADTFRYESSGIPIAYTFDYDTLTIRKKTIQFHNVSSDNPIIQIRLKLEQKLELNTSIPELLDKPEFLLEFLKTIVKDYTNELNTLPYWYNYYSFKHNTHLDVFKSDAPVKPVGIIYHKK